MFLISLLKNYGFLIFSKDKEGGEFALVKQLLGKILEYVLDGM